MKTHPFLIDIKYFIVFLKKIQIYFLLQTSIPHQTQLVIEGRPILLPPSDTMAPEPKALVSFGNWLKLNNLERDFH